MRDGGDRGQPIVVSQADHPATTVFSDIANGLLARLEKAAPEKN